MSEWGTIGPRTLVRHRPRVAATRRDDLSNTSSSGLRERINRGGARQLRSSRSHADELGTAASLPKRSVRTAARWRLCTLSTTFSNDMDICVPLINSLPAGCEDGAVCRGSPQREAKSIANPSRRWCRRLRRQHDRVPGRIKVNRTFRGVRELATVVARRTAVGRLLVPDRYGHRT